MHKIRFSSGRIFLVSWLIVPALALWIATNYIIGLTHKPAWVGTSAGSTTFAKPVIDTYAEQPLKWSHEPLVTLWFDDAWQSEFTSGYPAMQARGLVGALAVPTSFVGMDSYMGWSQIQLLQHQGWEITSHTRHHTCDQEQLTPAYIDTELHGALSDLNRHGILANNFVTPCGVGNTAMAATAKKYYSSLRSSDGGLNPIPVTDPYHLKVEAIVRTTTVADVDSWAAQAKASNSWLILMFHQTDHDETKYGTSPEILAQILDHVVQSGIQVALPDQVLQVGAPQ